MKKLIIIALLALPLAAADWTLQTADQIYREVEITTLDETGLEIMSRDGEATIAWADVFWIQEPLTARAYRAPLLATVTGLGLGSLVMAAAQEDMTPGEMGLSLTLSATTGLGVGMLFRTKARAAALHNLMGLDPREKLSRVRTLQATNDAGVN